MITLPSSLLQEIKDQARREQPNEACGYLYGHVSDNASLYVVDRIEMTNIDSSPEHYSFSPKEQFAALKKAGNEGCSLISVYHSHPETPARMSQEDIQLANDTEIVYLIYSLPGDTIKGFKVDGDKNVTDYPVEIRK